MIHISHLSVYFSVYFNLF